LSKGDYIFVEKCDTETLQVGDVITYFTMIQGNRAINTHRIVDVIEDNGMLFYQTQGDNKETNPEPDELLLAPGDVIGLFTGKKVPALGAIIDYLSTKMGFFLVILLPVLLFTIYQIFNLVKIIIHNHKVDLINEATGEASDEMKEAIIAEYLAKKNNEETN
jgi:signal peptidase